MTLVLNNPSPADILFVPVSIAALVTRPPAAAITSGPIVCVRVIVLYPLVAPPTVFVEPRSLRSVAGGVENERSRQFAGRCSKSWDVLRGDLAGHSDTEKRFVKFGLNT